MRSNGRAAAALAWTLALAACAPAAPPEPTYDLVIANGRVMDPESGLDAVRHVGVRGGRIEAISETPLQGTRVVDAWVQGVNAKGGFGALCWDVVFEPAQVQDVLRKFTLR